MSPPLERTNMILTFMDGMTYLSSPDPHFQA